MLILYTNIFFQNVGLYFPFIPRGRRREGIKKQRGRKRGKGNEGGGKDHEGEGGKGQERDGWMVQEGMEKREKGIREKREEEGRD